MFILALVIVVIAMFISTGGGITAMIDIPSLILPVAITLVILASAGLFKDFLRAFKVSISKENIYTSKELKKSKMSVALALKTLFLSGLGITIIGFVVLLPRFDDPLMLKASLAVSMISVMYSVFLMVLLLPVDYKIRSILLDLEEEND